MPRALAAVALAIAAIVGPRPLAQSARPAAFPSLIERLSEPGGEFGGDNLISNEQSYLHVLPALARARVAGGAYLGVGPDQNFSYIAQIHPLVAFVIDIRRDNLLLHLLFKALFAVAPTRLEYLSGLTGRAPPATLEAWRGAGIDKLVGYIDATRPMSEAGLAALRDRLDAHIRATGVPLAANDWATIHAFHQQFIARGLDLVFQVRGQAVRDYYPNLRQLLLETDGSGTRASYLAADDRYATVRALEQADRVIPVVGDVSGPRAMRGIAAEIETRGLTLSGFYISNVEFYLSRDGRFPAFVDNLKRLPRDERSFMIRSVFPGGFPGVPPQHVPGYYSASLVQPIGTMLADLAAGKYRSYADMIYASYR